MLTLNLYTTIQCHLLVSKAHFTVLTVTNTASRQQLISLN